MKKLKTILIYLAIVVSTYFISMGAVLGFAVIMSYANVTISDFSLGFLFAISVDFVYNNLSKKFLAKKLNPDNDSEDCAVDRISDVIQ